MLVRDATQAACASLAAAAFVASVQMLGLPPKQLALELLWALGLFAFSIPLLLALMLGPRRHDLVYDRAKNIHALLCAVALALCSVGVAMMFFYLGIIIGLAFMAGVAVAGIVGYHYRQSSPLQ